MIVQAIGVCLLEPACGPVTNNRDESPWADLPKLNLPACGLTDQDIHTARRELHWACFVEWEKGKTLSKNGWLRLKMRNASQLVSS